MFFYCIKRALLGLATVGLVSVFSVPAATAQVQYTAIGSGARASCGTWVEARRGGRGLTYEQWLLGFLSGVGWTQSNSYNPLQGLDANGVLVWVDNYCQKQPLSEIAVAAAEFVHAHPR